MNRPTFRPPALAALAPAAFFPALASAASIAVTNFDFVLPATSDGGNNQSSVPTGDAALLPSDLLLNSSESVTLDGLATRAPDGYRVGLN